MNYSSNNLLKNALSKTLDFIEQNPQVQKDKEYVLSHYGRIFSPESIDQLTEEEFLSFLLFKNNRHWKSIHRQSKQLVSDFEKLKEALKILVDESKDIKERLDFLRPKTKAPFIKGLSRAIITPILLVVYPEKYGVLNAVSEAGMKKAGVFPKLSKGVSFAEKYIAVNNVLRQIRDDFNIDFWILDILWWNIGEEISEPTEIEIEEDLEFQFEKYLQEFLIENWENIDRFKDWEILEEDDELIGVEYQTNKVGNIDILAKRKLGKDWLVIELKKGRTSDKTIGQILRYIGWVRKNLAESNAKVKGLIIAKGVDPKLEYALKETENIDVHVYRMNFELKPYEF
ncbi:MAG: DUF1016 family protein [Calditrichaeota bacterium]|nr:DUF1016 family protein [Calditrichota bacterium]